MKGGSEMKRANFAPVYACLYPELAEIARSHGYALAVHGNMAREFDLACIPWVENPSKPIDVVNEMVATFAIKTVGEPEGSENRYARLGNGDRESRRGH